MNDLVTLLVEIFMRFVADVLLAFLTDVLFGGPVG